MIKYVCFTARYYNSLTAGAITLLSVFHISETAENICTTVQLWYKALLGNVWYTVTDYI